MLSSHTITAKLSSKTGTILLFFLTCLLTAPSFAAELYKIDTHTTDNTTSVILHLNEKVRFIKNYLPADNKYAARCYVNLYDTSRARSLPTNRILNNQLLTKIRTGRHTNMLRVVLDLKENYECTIDSTTNPFSITLTVSDPKKQVVEITKQPNEVHQVDGSILSIASDNIAKAKEVNQEPALPFATTSAQEQQAELENKSSFFTEIDKAEISTWGWLQAFTAHDLNEREAEDHQISRLRGMFGADWNTTINDEYSLQLKGSLDIGHTFYEEELADDDTDIDLGETYLNLSNSSWDIAIGKQRVRWGKSDQLSPVDSINPQDLRHFITFDLEERAIPSWLLRTRWYGDTFAVETILKPWFQKSELDYFDSDWALYRNARQAIISNPAATPELKNYARSVQVAEDKPNASLENISAAARLSWQSFDTDFATSYHYGWETLPTISNFPVKNIDYSGDPDSEVLQGITVGDLTNEKVEAAYKRQQTFGFEWETAFELIGFRGEIAYKDKIAFLTRDLTSTRKATTHLVSGIDYTSETEWYLNIQGSWQHIHSYEKDILYFEKDTVSVLGEIRKPVWRDNLVFSAKYNYTFTDQSSYLQPSVTLKYFRNIKCELGGMIFSGQGDTLLGSYDDADQIYAIIKYSF